MTALFLCLALLQPAKAQDRTLTIGYLALQADPRYSETRREARYLLQTTGRPLPAAELALEESRFPGLALGVTFELVTAAGRNPDELRAALDELAGQGVRFVLADLPAELLSGLAAASRDRELLLFNLSARE
ncbi:MAG: hypothetical protein R3202_08175, partial [Candidatus Competibacterales bacterium]|nr:hypothetical protein [Candidatus Competibacterales bacterium]